MLDGVRQSSVPWVRRARASHLTNRCSPRGVKSMTTSMSTLGNEDQVLTDALYRELMGVRPTDCGAAAGRLICGSRASGGRYDVKPARAAVSGWGSRRARPRPRVRTAGSQPALSPLPMCEADRSTGRRRHWRRRGRRVDDSRASGGCGRCTFERLGGCAPPCTASLVNSEVDTAPPFSKTCSRRFRSTASARA
jgi:hypothetical protein